MTRKSRYFWPLLLILFSSDCTTKDLAREHLDPSSAPHRVIDSFLQFRLVHNPDTAFGFDLSPYLGMWERPLLILAMATILLVLLRVYWVMQPRARLAAAALGLACGGAIGNLVDRVRFSHGVVDFIDVGIGQHRFWIFNVADIGVFMGAMLLAFVMLREEAAERSLKATT